MKKISILFLIAVLSTVLLISCNKSNKSNTATQNATTSTEPPIHIHTEIIDASVEATCTSKGLTEGKHCSECGEILVNQEEIPLKSHTYYDDKDITCNVCGHERTCNHQITTVLQGKDATCTSTGLTEGKHCSICNTVLIPQNPIDMKPHSYEKNICVSCGDIHYSEGLDFISNGDGTCSVSKIGICTDEYLMIPLTSPIGDRVTNIQSDAFAYSSIVSVTIPDSVTRIESYSFDRCSSLTSIIISASVTMIEEYAFSGCYYLTVYCEAKSQPTDWDIDWNKLNMSGTEVEVVWNYQK